MKLYREVLIETAEQAEALPLEAIAHDSDPLHACAEPLRIQIDPGLWRGDTYYGSEDMVGWTALVPIEAKEETRIDPEVFAEIDARLAYTQAAYALPPGELQLRHVTRLVTPWTTKEEA